MRFPMPAVFALFLALSAIPVFAKNEHMADPVLYRLVPNERPDIAQMMCVDAKNALGGGDGSEIRPPFQVKFCVDGYANSAYIFRPFGDSKTVAGYVWVVDRALHAAFVDGPIYVYRVVGPFWGTRILSTGPEESRIAFDIYPDGLSGERVSREFSVPSMLPLQSEIQK